MTETDKIRIVPHTPFLYRIERLFLLECGEELWRTLGDLRYYMDKGAPAYKDVWYVYEELPYYKILEAKTFDTVESAKLYAKEVLEKEKKEEGFMNQEPVYV